MAPPDIPLIRPPGGAPTPCRPGETPPALKALEAQAPPVRTAVRPAAVGGWECWALDAAGQWHAARFLKDVSVSCILRFYSHDYRAWPTHELPEDLRAQLAPGPGVPDRLPNDADWAESDG